MLILLLLSLHHLVFPGMFSYPFQVLHQAFFYLAYLIIIGLHRAFFYLVMAVLARDSDHHLSSIMLYLLLLLPSSFNTIMFSY